MHSRYGMQPGKPEGRAVGQFTTIPPAAVGGSERVAPIAGRATGIRPGQRIVLYAKSGVWWVQPLTSRAVHDASGRTRPGEHDPSRHGVRGPARRRPAIGPRLRTEALPQPGGGVIAVASVKGTGDSRTAAPSADLQRLRMACASDPQRPRWPERLRPGQRLDRRGGALHLSWRSATGAGRAEVILDARARLRHIRLHRPRHVEAGSGCGLRHVHLGRQGAEQNHRELDIEISQWGDPAWPTRSTCIQPYYVPANVARFSAPAGA